MFDHVSDAFTAYPDTFFGWVKKFLGSEYIFSDVISQARIPIRENFFMSEKPVSIPLSKSVNMHCMHSKHALR